MLTTLSDWSHCPGEENPADLTTRGLSAESLVGSQLWLSGPSWLSTPQARPSAAEAVVAGVELPEAARPVRAVEGSCSAVTVSADLPCLLAAAREPVFDCSRWSSLTKSVRVVGWVRRFYGNARSAPQDRRCGDLSVAEIESARHVLLREEQRQAFSAEYSLLQQGKTVPKSSSVHQLGGGWAPEDQEPTAAVGTAV